MADNNTERDSVLAIVGNIPSTYHSADLRRYFSQFIESGGFTCFHFKHRPEGKRDKNEGEDVSETSKSDNVTKTYCCVMKVKKDRFEELIQFYHRHHWQDSEGESMPSLCVICAIAVSSDLPNSAKYLSKKDQKLIPKNREQFTQQDLQSLSELKPPPLMPQGNVGTRTMYFLAEIQACRLPPSIVKKLELTFPKQRSNRLYGSVEYDYGTEIVADDGEESEYAMKSASGKEIVSEDCAIIKPDNSKENTEQVTEGHEEEDNADNESTEDMDDCEEWERHEALHDEPRKGERNKERLFEEKIELKWEKGGSGLVFYTDAQYWKKQEGDFDEQTADDWDVDMSIYYDKDGGDVDARDFATMRRDMRRREGDTGEDLTIRGQDFLNQIGAFEKHTKGIGRRVMEKQGWMDGQGLGRTYPGMADALDNDGQGPWNKAGIGYYGEKVQRFGVKRPCMRDDDTPIITTKYDKQEKTDPSEPLLRRNHPYHIKHRHSQLHDVQFVRPSSPETNNMKK